MRDAEQSSHREDGRAACGIPMNKKPMRTEAAVSAIAYALFLANPFTNIDGVLRPCNDAVHPRAPTTITGHGGKTT